MTRNEDNIPFATAVAVAIPSDDDDDEVAVAVASATAAVGDIDINTNDYYNKKRSTSDDDSSDDDSDDTDTSHEEGEEQDKTLGEKIKETVTDKKFQQGAAVGFVAGANIFIKHINFRTSSFTTSSFIITHRCFSCIFCFSFLSPHIQARSRERPSHIMSTRKKPRKKKRNGKRRNAVVAKWN